MATEFLLVASKWQGLCGRRAQFELNLLLLLSLHPSTSMEGRVSREAWRGRMVENIQMPLFEQPSTCINLPHKLTLILSYHT